MGQLWERGWTIMDVTAPSRPRVLNFIPGPTNTWTIQMDVEEGKMITALERIAPGWGGDPEQPNDEGVLIWSLEDPVNPQLLGQFRTEGTGTHRDGYYGGRYVHLAAGMPGYSGNIAPVTSASTAEDSTEALTHASIVDIAAPATPKFLSVLPAPVPPRGLPYRNFCKKPGRFGPPNPNQHRHSPFTDHSDHIFYLT